ncbi:RHS repeat-associated core domain-containing protein [Microtetraspora sp. NBRC 13810]|uniref:RHS repeat-associated core domain-containing protein n=1 Tax=Microtetraspora sp. NBRC 13810 TaxID=3030990 RepID=UPI002552BF8D|nr:RHS repeat-associated core domain-containing protein [Microtetraspora sp. NBRC 13810]
MTTRTKDVSQQNFYYTGLSNDIAAITDGSNTLQAKYSRDPFGDILGLQEGATPGGALTDLHGDLVATFSANALTGSTAYDPFGQATSSGLPRALGYQSEYTDPHTGSVNMHSRWYQPGSGRFSSRDTVTIAPFPSVQGNRYTYANASPLTGTDHNGHETMNVIDYGSNPGGFPCNYYCQNAPDTPTQATQIADLRPSDGSTPWDLLDIRDWTAKEAGKLPNGYDIPPGMTAREFWLQETDVRVRFMIGYEHTRESMTKEEFSALGEGDWRTAWIGSIDPCSLGCGGGGVPKLKSYGTCKVGLYKTRCEIYLTSDDAADLADKLTVYAAMSGACAGVAGITPGPLAKGIALACTGAAARFTIDVVNISAANRKSGGDGVRLTCDNYNIPLMEDKCNARPAELDA